MSKLSETKLSADAEAVLVCLYRLSQEGKETGTPHAAKRLGWTEERTADATAELVAKGMIYQPGVS